MHSTRQLLIFLVFGGCSLSDLDRFYLAADGGTCTTDPNACQGKCGQLTNRCHEVVTCGDCPNGQTCGGGGPNICGTGSCVPDCSGKPCGASDGCSGVCTMGACGSGQRCVAGVCTCDTMSCTGCCAANQCQTGTLDSACGAGGAMCMACGNQTICDVTAGQCVACGRAGEACCQNASCSSGYTCSLGTCITTMAIAVGIGGGNGVAFQWNGTAWSGSTTVAGAQDLYAIWGADANDVWAVGDGLFGGVRKGATVHWNGSSWSTPIAISGSTELFGVWGSSGLDLWAVGTNGGSGVEVHGGGFVWSQPVTFSGIYELKAVWGSSSTDVWAVGDDGCDVVCTGYITHWNGVTWSSPMSIVN